MQRFKIKHELGDGEAVKERPTEPWEVSVPEGGFRYHGTVWQAQREIERRCPACTGFGPTEKS
jgi:hypothetical protein